MLPDEAERIEDREPHRVRGERKRALRVPVTKRTIADDVAADRGVQDRCTVGQRCFRVHDRRQPRVFDPDMRKRVLGHVAIVGDDHCHGLAGVAHALLREAPVLHRLLDADDERLRPRANVGARKHRVHARFAQRCAGVDADDIGVRVRRTNDCRMQRAGLDAEVVGKGATTGQKPRVLEACK